MKFTTFSKASEILSKSWSTEIKPEFFNDLIGFEFFENGKMVTHIYKNRVSLEALDFIEKYFLPS